MRIQLACMVVSYTRIMPSMIAPSGDSLEVRVDDAARRTGCGFVKSCNVRSLELGIE